MHNGQFLIPYLTLDSQGVMNGDLIILHIVSQPTPKKSRKHHSKQPERSDSVVAEMLRLSDVAFLPYEVSSLFELVYQQIWLEEQEDEEANDAPKNQSITIIGKPPQCISADPLPALL
jgi:hypothetical protein